MSRLVDIDIIKDNLQVQCESETFVIYDSYKYGSVADSEILITCDVYIKSETRIKTCKFIIKYDSTGTSNDLKTIIDDMPVFVDFIIFKQLKDYIIQHIGWYISYNGYDKISISEDVFMKSYILQSL